MTWFDKERSVQGLLSRHSCPEKIALWASKRAKKPLAVLQAAAMFLIKDLFLMAVIVFLQAKAGGAPAPFGWDRK